MIDLLQKRTDSKITLPRYFGVSAKNSPERGFIALMSVIIISAVLLVLVFTLGVSSFFNRFSTLDREYKRVSNDLAEACVNVAMVKLAQDSSYSLSSPGECVGVGDTCGASGATRVCKICSVSGSGTKTIRARAVYSGAYTNLLVTGTLSSTNFSIASWQEETAGVSGCTVP